MPSIVVFEKHARWGPELQRQFLDEDVQIRVCRTIRDIRPLLDSAPASILLLDLEGAAAECLQFLGRAQPAELTILIGSRPASELEWAFRELGVLDFAPDDVPGEQLARLCRRQFAAGV